ECPFNVSGFRFNVADRSSTLDFNVKPETFFLWVELPIRLGKEQDAANVVPRLVGGMGLEDLVFRPARVFFQDSFHSAGSTVVGGERVDRISSEVVEQPPEVGGPQPSVDLRVVEKGPPIALPQNRLDQAARGRRHQLRQAQSSRSRAGGRLENAFLANEAAQKRRLQTELRGALRQVSSLLDRIVETPPRVGHATFPRRAHLRDSAFGGGPGGRGPAVRRLRR